MSGSLQDQPAEGNLHHRRGSSWNARPAAIGLKIFGEPPAQDAPRVQRLRYIRRFYTRALPLYLCILAVAALVNLSALMWLPIGLSALIWIQGFTSLSLRIDRELELERF